jgi:hypothetical protein
MYLRVTENLLKLVGTWQNPKVRRKPYKKKMYVLSLLDKEKIKEKKKGVNINKEP